MPKYIDFDALGVQSCNPDVFVNKGYAEGWNSLMRMLYDAPAADVEPVRHGRWIKSPECPEEYDICSVCGLNDKHRTRADQEHPAFESLPPRCKWCGAKMDKEEADDKPRKSKAESQPKNGD